MKKITLIICLLGASLFGYSQQSGQIQDSKWNLAENKRLELMKSGAALSPEQMQKWMQVVKTYNYQIEELKKANRQSEIPGVNQAMQAELNTIFTPEQHRKLDEIRANSNKSKGTSSPQ